MLEEKDNVGLGKEEERESPVATGSNNIKSSHGRRIMLMGVILLGGFFIFLWDSLQWDSNKGDVQLKVHTAMAMRSESPPPLTNTTRMLDHFLHARQKWTDKRLKKDYGEEAYWDIFEPLNDKGERVNVGQHRAFVDPNRLPRPGKKYEDYKNSNGLGWNRMVRKWTIKILQLQLGMLQGYDNHNNKDGLYGKFVWANGGHSASAGHGNFYRESYTAVLERDLQPILKEIGLDFQVRNYAMGGTESGEEVALCFNSIFGKDVDSITWDYGMTDGGQYHKFILYAYNAARLARLEDNFSQPGNVRHRPSLLVLHHNDELHPVLQTIQDLGLPMLAMDTRFQKDKMYPGFPDMLGKTDAEIAATPPYVQYFKCNDQIEAGDPGCADKKFNRTICPDRDGRNTWHPGWRYHALMGHTMALTVLEIITEALHELIALEPTNPETAQEKEKRLLAHLLKLDALEQQDYNHMLQTPIPIELKLHFEESLWKGDQKDANKEAMKDHGIIDALVKDFSFCHTAILPAEIRYRGLLTGNLNATGTVMDNAYEHGFMQSLLMKAETPNEDGKKSFVFLNHTHGQQLVLASDDREYETCEEPTMKNHKDFFFISSREGWRTLSFPNNAEKEYYSEFNVETSKKWIFICMTYCWWGKCKDGDIRESIMDGSLDAKEFGHIEMEVNGVSVSDAKCFNKCCALRHEDPEPSLRFQWAPNAEGRFDF